MAKELFVVGLSWRTAPVSMREQLAFRDEEIETSLQQLVSSPSIDEAVIVSTCNRVEIYGVTSGTPESGAESAAAEARHFLVTSRGVKSESVAGVMYDYLESDAIAHVFRVASALDSLVLGESQVLGQVKAAYGASVAADAAGVVLNKWLQQAFTVAKRVRSETGIARGAANVSSVAVELARRVFGELDGKRVLVVGAGKMSVLAARHLVASGAGAISVTNRSAERAEALAHEIEGVARPWSELQNLVAGADVIISSTGSQRPILGKALMKPALKTRRHKPIVIVDIAVPRDADPAISRLDGVFLFDIDDLEHVVTENLKERKHEADAANEIVVAELASFERWYRSQKVVPTIRNLREHFSRVALTEAEKVIRDLGEDHSPDERERAIRRLGDLIVNKLLHAPMSTLKGAEDLELVVEVTQRLFDLPEEDAERRDDSGPEDTDGSREEKKRGSA